MVKNWCNVLSMDYSFREFGYEAHEPVNIFIWLTIVTPTDRPKLVGNLREFDCWMCIIATLNHLQFYVFSVTTRNCVS